MIKPITPNAVIQPRPDYIITAFNILIKKNFHAGKAFIKQEELLEVIKQQMFDLKISNITQFDILENGWLDNIQNVYAPAGWTVLRSQESTQFTWMFTPTDTSIL